MILFSERSGHNKRQMLKPDEMPGSLRTGIWNIIWNNVFNRVKADPMIQFINDRFDAIPYHFTDTLLNEFFLENAMLSDAKSPSERVEHIHQRYSRLSWFRVYDFIEFFLRKYPSDVVRDAVVEEINKLLVKERAAYRVVNTKIIPLTSEEVTEEFESVLSLSDDFKAVAEHFGRALSLWADRENPDYVNSVKESISSVESLVQILLGEKGTLSDLIEKLNVHPAMKKGFEKLYNWTSDASGIRHGEYGDIFVCGEAEARYMLFTCSAFVNYCIEKKSV